MASSKNARERARRAEQRSARRRREKMAERLGVSPEHSVPTPVGVAKVSDVLLAFGQPVIDTLDATASIDDYRSALKFVSAAWNLLVLLEVERDRSAGVLVDQDRVREITGMLEELVGGFDEEGLAMLAALQDSRRPFAGDHRIVMNVDAELRGDRIHVTAAHNLPYAA